MRRMLPSAIPDLTLAMEISSDTDNDMADIDQDAVASVPSSGVDVVDAFDLPYNMRNISAGGGGRVTTSSFEQDNGTDTGVPSISHTVDNVNNGNTSTNVYANYDHAAANAEFDRKLVEVSTSYLQKIGTQCMRYISNYCWSMISYENISNDFLLKVSGGCGLSAIVFTTARTPLSLRLGPTGNRLLDQVNNSVMPILTGSATAATFLYIFKTLFSEGVFFSSFDPLIRRGSRKLSRCRVMPQMVTIFSLLIALFAYKTKVELTSMQWLIKIWASRVFNMVRNFSLGNIQMNFNDNSAVSDFMSLPRRNSNSRIETWPGPG